MVYSNLGPASADHWAKFLETLTRFHKLRKVSQIWGAALNSELKVTFLLLLWSWEQFLLIQGFRSAPSSQSILPTIKAHMSRHLTCVGPADATRSAPKTTCKISCSPCAVSNVIATPPDAFGLSSLALRNLYLRSRFSFPSINSGQSPMHLAKLYLTEELPAHHNQ